MTKGLGVEEQDVAFVTQDQLKAIMKYLQIEAEHAVEVQIEQLRDEILRNSLPEAPSKPMKFKGLLGVATPLELALVALPIIETVFFFLNMTIGSFSGLLGHFFFPYPGMIAAVVLACIVIYRRYNSAKAIQKTESPVGPKIREKDLDVRNFESRLEQKADQVFNTNPFG